MQIDDFMQQYLEPVAGGVVAQYRLPLPEVPELTKTSDFIVQSHAGDTWSTNIVSRYDSAAAGVRLVEVYKNTQNHASGAFVRLVGTMALVRPGMPCLFLDAAVSNINMQTGARQTLETRVAIHVPQAEPGARAALLADLTAQAQQADIVCRQIEVSALPSFWGPLWCAQASELALDCIARLRDAAWHAYQVLCDASTLQPDFDYQPVQVQMVLKNSRAEHGQFSRMGLDVPVEVQAAFFSILVSGC